MSVLAHEIHQQVVFMPFCSIYFLCADHFLVFFIVLFVLFCLRIFLFVVIDSDTLLSVHFRSNDSKELSVMNHLV